MSTRAYSRTLGALGLSVAFALTIGASARADEATAESLFRAATDLAKAGNYAAACPKFAESQRESPANGTLVALGDCYRKQGKTASAWATYKDLAAAAKKAGDVARADAASQMAATLERDLSRLTVQASDPDPSRLAVRRDGEEMSAAVLGTPIAVDPGEHVIEVTRPGCEPFRATVTLGPSGDSKAVVIPACSPSSDAAAGLSSSRRTAGWILGGAGLVVAGVGAVFGILTLSDASKIKGDATLCGGGTCTRKGDSAASSATTKSWVASIALPVGGAAAGTGAVLIFTSRDAGASVGGIRLTGTF